MEQLEIHLMYGDVMAQVDAEQSVLKCVLNAMDQVTILFTAWDSVVWVNNATAEILNHSFSHYRDRSITELFAEDNQSSPVEFIQQDDSVKLINDSQVCCVAGEEQTINWRIYSLSGEQSLYLLLGERSKQAVQVNDATLTYLQSVVQRMPGCVFWTDARQVFQGCNQGFVDYFGLSDSSVIEGQSHQSVESLKSMADFFAEDEATIKEARTIKDQRQTYEWHDHTLRTYIVNKAPLYDDQQQVIGMLGSFIDITKQQELWTTQFSKTSYAAANQAIDHPHAWRVLIVEDNEVSAMAIYAMLASMHCMVDQASSGQQALMKAEYSNYDIILMDIGLPDIDGVEVAERIRLLSDARHANVPIIAVTSYTDVDQKQRCYASGMQALLNKPVQCQSLEALFKKYA